MNRGALIWVLVRSAILWMVVFGGVAVLVGSVTRSLLLGVSSVLAYLLIMGCLVLIAVRRRRRTPPANTAPPPGGWRRWEDDGSDSW